MTGWFFIITDPTLSDPKYPESRANVLAEWQTGYRGAWIEKLVAKKKAVLVKENMGYPDHYRALAKDLLPLISKYADPDESPCTSDGAIGSGKEKEEKEWMIKDAQVSNKAGIKRRLSLNWLPRPFASFQSA